VFLDAFVDLRGRPTFLDFGCTVCQLSGILKVAGAVEAGVVGAGAAVGVVGLGLGLRLGTGACTVLEVGRAIVVRSTSLLLLLLPFRAIRGPRWVIPRAGNAPVLRMVLLSKSVESSMPRSRANTTSRDILAHLRHMPIRGAFETLSY
jgi:hypothetical protein